MAGQAGLSRDELGAPINYSGSLICLVENTTRVPTLAFAQRLDEALQTPGTFAWLDAERAATALR